MGLRFHTADLRHFWLYYVVDEACGPAHAVCAAIRRADRDPDRVTRGGVGATADQVEVLRVVQDGLGHVGLARSP
ncbi:hypothetical protein [Streptomyces sp. RB17]|uniref:hypothetical protein n=1 Tax=Streptomyces sp. RB17 TaxID=2585197 RepID=UPI00129668AA|nr:hypothetical protein [Streptomyces sp. RB17]